MFIIAHVDDKGNKRERHESSTTGMLAVMAEACTRCVAQQVGFTYAAKPLPSVSVDNGHRFYVEHQRHDH